MALLVAAKTLIKEPGTLLVGKGQGPAKELVIKKYCQWHRGQQKIVLGENCNLFKRLILLPLNFSVATFPAYFPLLSHLISG